MAYQIPRSLRFRSSASAYLSRAQTGGNRQKFTWSVWFKLGNKIGSTTPQCFFDVTDSATSSGRIAISSDTSSADVISYFDNLDGALVKTPGVYRDPSAWTHLLVSVDRTISNGVKIYINGSQVTTTGTQPSSGTSGTVNTNGYTMAVGRSTNSGYYFDGYMAQAHFVDGSALTPSTFGQLDAATNAWVPILVTGVTYGTNGFYLPFSDNSAATSTTIGKDGAGSNNITPTNISVTAGVTNDSLVDTPTNYGTDTGAGGEVRGNYCTWNPLRIIGGTTAPWSDGNLKLTSGSNLSLINWTTMQAESPGKYWAELDMSATGGFDAADFVGIVSNLDASAQAIDTAGTVYGYRKDGQKNVLGTASAYGTAWVTTDRIGIAVDLTNNTVQFYLQAGGTGSFVGQGTISITNAGYHFVVRMNNTTSSVKTIIGNFGQRAFAATAPSGFKALCTQNLPDPAIVKPASYFNAAIYTGNGTAIGSGGKAISTDGSTANNALLFKPDLVWIKGRSGATSHGIYDIVRTATKDWGSDLTTDETTQSEGVTSFDTTGFTTGSLAKLNTNTATYVSWLWKGAGSSSAGSGSGLTSISSSINATSGVSITAYTGHATGGDYFNHGLGVAPGMVIIKPRTTASTDYGATVWHSSLANTEYLVLQTTAAKVTGATTFWNSTTPDSTKVTLGTAAQVNASADTFIAYVFAEVAGFSKFGSYTGNAAADGPFVWCGFKPRFVMIKSSSTTDDWTIYDSARDTYNVMPDRLYADSNGTEGTTSGLDFLSNGFKLRTITTTPNAAQTYIFSAFADVPFKYTSSPYVSLFSYMPPMNPRKRAYLRR